MVFIALEMPLNSAYQNVAKESGIYTGREANLRTDAKLQDLGARLKRIPEDMNQEIQESLNQVRQR